MKNGKTKAAQTSVDELINNGERISSNITLCSDGKYRWVYEMSLIKNPTIFLTVWKIFLFIFIGIFAFVSVIELIASNDFFPDGLLGNLKVFGIIFLGMTVLTWLGCLIYALKMGGKYVVVFEMDEKGVNHKQIDWQAEKARRLSAATTVAGIAAGSLTAAGIGLTASRTEMYTEFSAVRRIKAYPRRNVIKLNERLEHNQVYAADEDFEFVKSFIVSHCTNLV